MVSTINLVYKTVQVRRGVLHADYMFFYYQLVKKKNNNNINLNNDDNKFENTK